MIDTTTHIPEKCECGRLYKDRTSPLGKKMCSACYTGLSVEQLKTLWSTPSPPQIKEIFGVKECRVQLELSE